MSGAFQHWQPIYEAVGIPTFPVGSNKRPLVSHYAKLGAKASRRLVERFADAPALGFMLPRANLAIIDVDSPDERVAADAMSAHGRTPIVVRSGSGNRQLWYRRRGERRLIRPWPGKPIDVLGDGYVVAPPSRGSRGSYAFEQGCLDDLADLPVMQGLGVLTSASDVALGVTGGRIGRGLRNDALFEFAMREARRSASLAELIERASAFAAVRLAPDPADPITPDEIRATATSAWSITEAGENRFGIGPHVVLLHETLDHYADDPDALFLLLKLRRHHWGRAEFVIARAMAESLSWDERRFLRARQRLEAERQIVCVNRGGRGKGDPPRFTWPAGPLSRGTFLSPNEKQHPPLLPSPVTTSGALADA